MANLPSIPEDLAEPESDEPTPELRALYGSFLENQARTSSPYLPIFERAIASPRGIALTYNNEDEARAMRQRFYSERVRMADPRFAELVLSVEGRELLFRKINPGTVREL